MFEFDFITADTHFNHKKIIALGERPFANTDEMDEMLIERWNARVGSRDTVLHLGDFANDDVDEGYLAQIRSRLNGRIVMTLGNHDPVDKLIRTGIVAPEDIVLWFKDKERRVNYSHLPLDAFVLFDSLVSVHGHTHGTRGLLDAPYPSALSVNTELNGYAPLSRNEFEVLLAQKLETAPATYAETNGWR